MKEVKQRNYKQGFTLLELLIVVMIIGILAAIALPQYQIAVEKSKSSQALTLIKAIDESIRSYNLATGHYPTSFDQLDITIPESFNIDEKFIPNGVTYGKSNKDWNISVERYNDESAVGLSMVRITGRYEGAGFAVDYTGAGGLVCFERKKSANYIFDSNLPAGAYCEKIMQGKYLQEDVYVRAYELN